MSCRVRHTARQVPAIHTLHHARCVEGIQSRCAALRPRSATNRASSLPTNRLKACENLPPGYRVVSPPRLRARRSGSLSVHPRRAGGLEGCVAALEHRELVVQRRQLRGQGVVDAVISDSSGRELTLRSRCAAVYCPCKSHSGTASARCSTNVPRTALGSRSRGWKPYLRNAPWRVEGANRWPTRVSRIRRARACAPSRR